jgi:hypothetical protein
MTNAACHHGVPKTSCIRRNRAGIGPASWACPEYVLQPGKAVPRCCWDTLPRAMGAPQLAPPPQQNRMRSAADAPTCATVLCLAQSCVDCLDDWIIVRQAVKLIVKHSLSSAVTMLHPPRISTVLDAQGAPSRRGRGKALQLTHST